MKHELQPYGEFQNLAPGLWTLDGEWFESPLKRRMTVVAFKDGSLLVHSPIRLRDDDYARLDQMGKLKWIVAPNAYHGDEAVWYQRKYPHARVLVAEEGLKKIKRTGATVDGVLPDALTVSPLEMQAFRFEGLRFLGEVVFFHPPTRTLILTDLAFNLPHPSGWFARWNEMDRGFGPTKIFRRVFLKDASRARQSFERMLDWDFDRVIMNHGVIIPDGGHALVKRSFETFFEKVFK